MTTVTSAINTFLAAQEHNAPDLIARWTPQMETQVNVSARGGEPVDGKPNTYTDGQFTWWNIRVPKKANSEPTWHDYELQWPLSLYAEAIGSTGWDWKERVSRWVGFDFDSITGHAAGVGIDDEQLEHIKQLACKLPYVEVRKSTGGAGIHLHVLLDSIPTADHTEHAALARCVLSMMSSECEFDFASQVDTCGGNLWIWHRKMTQGNEGLKLLKPATRSLNDADLSTSWREKFEPTSVHEATVLSAGRDIFDELTAVSTSLNDSHRSMIAEAARLGYASVWQADLHCWHTHTKALEEMGKLQGVEFATISLGTDQGSPNCYAYPKRNGWAVYRFGNAKETDTWHETNTGKVTCNFDFSRAGQSPSVLKQGPLERYTLGALRAAYPTLNPPVIDGLIREGETCNVISYSKVGKSWLGYDMALSVVFEDRLWPLRGNLRSLTALEDEFSTVEPGRFKLIILDAMYRFAIEGVSERDNRRA